MKFSSREAVLAFAAVVAAVIGGSSMLVKPRIADWQDLRLRQKDVRLRIEQDRKLVEQRDEVAAQIKELSDLLDAFPADKKMDVSWLSVVDSLAKKNGMELASRRAGDEKGHGDVYEMLIECKEWESDLAGLVHFLFDLQATGAMFDVRQLLIKPKGKGVLRGRFSLYCAYTRLHPDGAPGG